MVAYKLSVSANELLERMRVRLRANSAKTKVVWQGPDGQRLLIDTASLKGKFIEGWLAVSVDCQTDQTGKQNVQFVFCLGKPGEGDSVQAACTINAPTVGGAQIAGVWGADLQRVLWDAILDAIEATVHRTSTLKPGLPLTVKGFHCTPDMLHAEVFAGEF